VSCSLRPALLAILLLACACGSEEPAGADGGVRSQEGDTTVVRSLSGSEWDSPGEWIPEVVIGEVEGPPEQVFGRVGGIAVEADGGSEGGRIFVLDRQVPTVRVYDVEGTYLDSWGRRGGGPGELEGPDSGLALLPDGRLVVRDPGNARLQVYSAQGEVVASWPVITGQYINRRAFALQGDTLLNPDLVNPMDPLPEWRQGLVRIAPDGTVLDTLEIPESGRRAHRFVARVGGNTGEIDLPFAPTEHWAWHPDGYLVTGVGDRYAINLDRAQGPRRIEREVASTAVTPAEEAQEEQRVMNAMRWLDRGWRWEGPRIPDTKPTFSGIWTGLDGRIWVLREGDAYESDDPSYDPTDPFDTEIRWRSERLLDAFTPDGTFLGTATLPRDLDERVAPVLRGDRMWAVTRDALGVQRVVGYRLERTAAAP
jgi:hypothetical protein